jgi:hypothetical protein
MRSSKWPKENKELLKKSSLQASKVKGLSVVHILILSSLNSLILGINYNEHRKGKPWVSFGKTELNASANTGLE